MALVKMVPNALKDGKGRTVPRPKVPEPYEENAEWVRDHRGQWWWRPMNPRNWSSPPDALWYSEDGLLRAYPSVEYPQGKGKENSKETEEEPWYSADGQQTAYPIVECPQGKGKEKAKKVEEVPVEEYWEEDSESWGHWGEDLDQPDMETWAYEQGFRGNAPCSSSSGKGHLQVQSVEHPRQQQLQGEAPGQEMPFVWGMDPELRQRGRTEVLVIPPETRSRTADGRNKATVARSERRKRSKSKSRMEAEAGLAGQREATGVMNPVQAMGHQQETDQPRVVPVLQGLPGRNALIRVRDIGTALDPVVARLGRRRRDYTLGSSECQDIAGRLRSVTAGVGVLRTTGDVQLASRTLQGMARDLEVMEQAVMVLEGRIGRLHQVVVQDEEELARARTGVASLINLLGGGFPSLAAATRQ